MTEKLYTILCKCGWETNIGEAGQPLDDFIFHLRGATKLSCPQCGAKKLFIKNKQRLPA
jgi:hypothetical protein